MRNRLLKAIRIYMILALAAIAYYIFYLWSGYGIPCLFRTLTGLSCPGCGISRMFAAILNGNLNEAFGYNRLVFITLPVFVLYAARYTFFYVRDGYCRDGRVLNAAKWLMAAAFIIFGVMRNIVL